MSLMLQSQTHPTTAVFGLGAGDAIFNYVDAFLLQEDLVFLSIFWRINQPDTKQQLQACFGNYSMSLWEDAFSCVESILGNKSGWVPHNGPPGEYDRFLVAWYVADQQEEFARVVDQFAVSPHQPPVPVA